MSGHQASLHLRWAFADAGHVTDPAPPFAVLGPPTTLRLALTQAGEQLAAQFTARHGVDRLVDSLTRSPDDSSVPSSRRLRLPAICSGDHCSRSSFATSANNGLSGASLARRPPPRCRRGLRRAGGVGAIRFPTAPDLRTDHAGRPAKLPRDRPHTVLAPQIDR